MKKLLLILLSLPIFMHAQTSNKVLIIGIDGCRPDALELANTPNIDNLISNGLYSPDALNDDITISGPGWSAILCGVWSNKHLSVDNSFIGTDYTNYPPLFKYIEDFDANLHTVSICHWNPINDYIVQNHADYKLNVSSDADVSTEATNYLTANDPDIMFLHFDDVDHAGHAYGFSPNVSEYMTAIEETDAFLAPIMQSIIQRPNYSNEDWLVLITTDHGGLGTSHGGNSIEEQNIFVIASGNTITQEIIRKDSSLIFDSVYNCMADTVELQFDGDDYVQIPSNSSYNFGSNQDFTIECRVRTNTTGDVAIIGNKNWLSGNNSGFVFSFKYPAGPEWKVNIGDGTNRVDINTGGLIADNQWHTLSVSFDRDGYMKMYEDGQLLDSANISSVGDITTNAGLFFGADINQSYSYNGSIAEVRVWNTVINNQNIQSWHCNQLDNNHPNYNNLIGYWKLNDGSGTTMAMDYVGGFGIPNGTINNATWYSPDSTWVYDYSNTPRLTDVPVTALTHLCIPIDNNWQLDGISLIPNCSSTILEEIDGEPTGIIKITDVLARKTQSTRNNPLFYIYKNGKVEKKIIVE
ncbi:MAG: LamG-like jellyroll fold domain-containing protein [Bacteroidota bacterium]|nr:LamG-like jellyroll fold domain-containing protein [Bacteroidota bacterium]